jgi:hypothetical protein
MSIFKSYFTGQYAYWKTRRSLKKLSEQSVNLPINAKQIKNVLILLPRQEEFVDAAMTLVRHLRQHFKSWHFMLLDIDKIAAHKLDRFNLPNKTFIEVLLKSKFQLVMNLNFEPDVRMDYLTAILRIPYRLHIQSPNSNYYNMFAQINEADFKSFHHVFSYLKSGFQV